MGKAFNITMFTLAILAVSVYVFQNHDPSLGCREEFVKTGVVTGNIIDKEIATQELNDYIDKTYVFDYKVTNPEWKEIRFLDPVLGLRFDTYAYVSYKFAIDTNGNTYGFRSCPE